MFARRRRWCHWTLWCRLPQCVWPCNQIPLDCCNPDRRHNLQNCLHISAIFNVSLSCVHCCCCLPKTQGSDWLSISWILFRSFTCHNVDNSGSQGRNLMHTWIELFADIFFQHTNNTEHWSKLLKHTYIFIQLFEQMPLCVASSFNCDHQ